MSEPRPEFRPSADVAASTFRLDVKAGEITTALRDAGVQAVLLKGRAFAALLYPEPGSRPYEDIDLLVPPASYSRAEDLLERWGFEAFDPESPSRQSDGGLGPVVGAQGNHGRAWFRTRDSLVVDLHDNLPQAGVEPEQAWACLREHVRTSTVGGAAVDVLDRPASALLVALHAAHHGPDWRSTAHEDLDRAIATFDDACWREAHALAVDLVAERSMGAGLGLTADGRELAARLGLTPAPTRGLELLWGGAPWSVTFVEAYRAERDPRARARLVARVLWPSRDAMRRGSALARRGRRGLVAAYGIRLVQIGRRVPGALRHGRGDATS